MITTLLLQTMMAVETSRPGVRTTLEQAATMVSVTPEQFQQVIDAAEAAKTSGEQALKAAEAVLTDQSWKQTLFGSPKRIAATIANGVLLGYGFGTAVYLLGFAPQSSGNTGSNGNTTTTAAPGSYLDQAKSSFDKLSGADQGLAISTICTLIPGAIGTVVQRCITKAQDAAEVVANFSISDEMTAGGGGNEPTATDWFKDVRSVTVGTGDDAVTYTLAGFQKREGFDASNPFAKDAFSVTLNDGTIVEISDVGLRMDQVPSAAASQ